MRLCGYIRSTMVNYRLITVPLSLLKNSNRLCFVRTISDSITPIIASNLVFSRFYKFKPYIINY